MPKHWGRAWSSEENSFLKSHSDKFHDLEMLQEFGQGQDHRVRFPFEIVLLCGSVYQCNWHGQCAEKTYVGITRCWLAKFHRVGYKINWGSVLQLSWVIICCSLVGGYKCFKGKYRIYFQCRILLWGKKKVSKSINTYPNYIKSVAWLSFKWYPNVQPTYCDFHFSRKLYLLEIFHNKFVKLQNICLL
jgi:hypothetical protein